MENTQQELTDLLQKIIDAIPSKIPNNVWNIPFLDRTDLIEEARSILSLIDNRGSEISTEDYEQLEPLKKRFKFLLDHTVPQLTAQAASAIPAYTLTLQQAKLHILNALPPTDKKTLSQQITKIKNRTRSMEARLNDVEPRTESLENMLERIENAYEAADQLPTDLESLSEAKEKITEIAQEASSRGEAIESLLATIKQQEKDLSRINNESAEILLRCETAYVSSTNVGLAAAFSERSKSLSGSIYFWVAGLIAALALTGIFGSRQITELMHQMTNPNLPITLALLNILLTIFSVGAPVWFAWLATKQIGQRFRLAEDYAFKASISRAYEGYRREAARIDDSIEGSDMEAQLLHSALTRLDEQPLRLVETPTHGSPWSEILASDTIQEAVKTIPGFVHQMRGLAEKAINKKNQKIKPIEHSTAGVEEPSDS